MSLLNVRTIFKQNIIITAIKHTNFSEKKESKCQINYFTMNFALTFFAL